MKNISVQKEIDMYRFQHVLWMMFGTCVTLLLALFAFGLFSSGIAMLTGSAWIITTEIAVVTPALVFGGVILIVLGGIFTTLTIASVMAWIDYQKGY
jgi:hypothetical protein